MHEFNIGTPAMHKGHQKEMMMMVDHGVLEADKINHDKMKMDMGGGKTMEHNDPNSALLEPGKSKEIVWKFSKAGTFEFACNVPGHYDAGMVGEARQSNREPARPRGARRLFKNGDVDDISQKTIRQRGLLAAAA